ncbi:MAG: hypothetical protein GX159_12025 [Flavobacteriaceae bacterium]|jgi:hypothetical protein|nr:hypothetical protein [Flavobacteriaceae bacterium]
MRTFLIVFSFLLSGTVFGQSLYQPCKKSADTYYEENFVVKLKKSSYGLQFDSFDRCLTDALKKGIERFMKETHRRDFRRNGEHSLQIVKDRGKYYVVEQESPLRLFELK